MNRKAQMHKRGAMMRWLCFVTCCAVLCTAAEAKQRPPNILVILADDMGPGDPGYDINVDGSNDGPDILGLPLYQGQRVHPFTGQVWANEMAIVSWNVLMTLAALSLPDDPNNPTVTEFDPNDVFRTDGCSYAAPQLCGNMQAYDSIVSARRSSISRSAVSRTAQRWSGKARCGRRVRAGRRHGNRSRSSWRRRVTPPSWRLCWVTCGVSMGLPGSMRPKTGLNIATDQWTHLWENSGQKTVTLNRIM